MVIGDKLTISQCPSGADLASVFPSFIRRFHRDRRPPPAAAATIEAIDHCGEMKEEAKRSCDLRGTERGDSHALSLPSVRPSGVFDDASQFNSGDRRTTLVRVRVLLSVPFSPAVQGDWARPLR